MTVSTVQKFLDKLGEDKALQAELTQALRRGNERQAVFELAKSKGYEFSSEELIAETQKRQSSVLSEESEELTEEDLEAIAGGVHPSFEWLENADIW